MEKPVLGITMGDAAGVGPEIIVKALADAHMYEISRPVVFGDKKILERAARITGSKLPIRAIESPSEGGREFGIIDVIDHDNLPADLPFAKLDARAGKAAYEYIQSAVKYALQHEVHAIVTAPLNKEALHMGGCPYPGHTEILGALTHTKDYSMMLVSGPQTEANFAAASHANLLRRPVDPRDVARTCLFLAENTSITGSTVCVDNGQHLVPLPRDIMFVVDELLQQRLPPKTTT